MKKFLVSLLVLSLLIVTSVSAAATTTFKTWVQTSAGMEDTPDHFPDTAGFVFSPNYAADHTVYAATYNGVFKSTDSGINWTLKSTGISNNHVNSLAISPNYINDHALLAGTGGGVFMSSDYAANWTDISAGLPENTIEVVAFHPAYNHSTNPRLFVGMTSTGVYITTTNAWNWQAMNGGLGAQKVRALAFTPGYATDPNGYLFAGTDDNWDVGGVFKIKKGDSSWTALNAGLPTSNLVVDALAISPNFASDQTLFVGIWAGQGIYRSTNAGSSWTFLDGTTSLYIQSLAISPYYPCDRTLFAGEDGGGVYVSKNKGATWNQINTGFDTGKSVLSLVVAPGKSNPALTLFSGVFSDGAWQYVDPHACVFMPLLKK